MTGLQVDRIDGVSRLLGSEIADFITLQPGDLREHEGGLWTLAGDDTVQGSSDGELIIANQDQDMIFGNSGDDTILGGRGNDFISGDAGNDFLRGDRDQDTIEGDAGNDTIFGGQQNDSIMGGDGDDYLSGDLDDDTLSGGNGEDTLIGGPGRDVFMAATGAGTDLISDFEQGIDIIQLPDGIDFNRLNITTNTLNQAVISVQQTGEVMLVLEGVPGNSLTQADFRFTDPTDDPLNADFQQRVLELTNQYRIENGLSPLTWNNLLDRAADSHSENMAVQDFFSHTDLQGQSSSDRGVTVGYGAFVGENIAVGYDTPEAVVQGWINSPPHRENLLNPLYQDIGIGYYYLENDTGSENWNHYWTQVFGSRS